MQIVANTGSLFIAQPIVQKSWQMLRSEEHTSELQSRQYLVCRLLLEKKKKTKNKEKKKKKKREKETQTRHRQRTSEKLNQSTRARIEAGKSG